MRNRIVVLLLVVFSLALLSTGALAQTTLPSYGTVPSPGGGGGIGLGVIKPFTGGDWSSTNLSFSWSIRLTKAPAFGVWADGIVVPETNNLQSGVGVNFNVGEGVQRCGLVISDDFKGYLDRLYLGGAVLTDKFDLNDWSHWSGGFYAKYTLVTF